MIIRDVSATLEVLTALKKLGVRIAIDDFGTGYGVLGHLKVLPVDVLKIDRQFVHDLGQDASAGDLAIVQSIIALANAFGLDVVAEGVETERARELLLQNGCHRAQGFLLCPPVDPDTMETLLRHH